MAPAATTTFKPHWYRKSNSRTITNHCIYQMPAELFIGQIFSDVPQRSTILLPPPSETRLWHPPECGPLRRSRPNLLNYKLSIWTTFIIQFITLLHLVCTISILLIEFWLIPIATTLIYQKKGLNVLGWGRLCTSPKSASLELCHSLAMVAKCLCTELVDPASIAPLMTIRCFALDKNHGVHPIRIGDTAGHIIVKATLNSTRQGVQEVAGSVQLCAGQISGTEAAVHAIRNFFPERRNWSPPARQCQQCLQLPRLTNSPTQHPESLSLPCYCPHQYL